MFMTRAIFRAQMPPVPPKPQRAHGKHSRTGCLTCKIRRVKCDETRPFCVRCTNFKVKCDGYAPQIKPSIQTVQAPKLLPKALIQAFIPTGLSTLRHENENEERYFKLFRDKTSFDINPYFPSSVRRFIFQSCGNPSIRHGVIAIGALHLASMTAESAQLTCPGKRAGQDPAGHHNFAIQQYSKAIKYMRDESDSVKKDIRTAIINSMVIICFEAYHGNYASADKQIQIGLLLIDEWRKQYPTANQNLLAYSSPAPDVIEDELLQRFGQLEIGSISFLDRRSMEEHEILRKSGDETLRNMPFTFSSIDEAHVYMNLILRRVQAFGFTRVRGVLRDKLKLGPETQPNAASMPGVAVTILTTFSDAFEDSPDAFLSKDVLFSELLDTLVAYIDEVLRWKDSFDSLMQREHQEEDSLGALILKLHFRGAYITLRAITPRWSGLHDDLNEFMEETVEDAERIREILSGNKTSCKFTLETGVIIPLYLVGLKCRVSAIRTKARNLLLSWPRREGIWDSRFAGRIIEWIQVTEEMFLEGDHVPIWAQVGVIGMDVDLPNRKVGMVYYQQTSADIPEKKVHWTTITW